MQSVMESDKYDFLRAFLQFVLFSGVELRCWITLTCSPNALQHIISRQLQCAICNLTINCRLKACLCVMKKLCSS